MNFVSPKTVIDLARKIKSELFHYSEQETKLILEICIRQHKYNENFSLPKDCYNNYGCIDFDKVLELIQYNIEVVCLIADSLGIETPRNIEVITDIKVLEKNIDIKNTFHDAINLVNNDPGSAIVKTRAAIVDFINKLSNSNIDDDIKSRLEAYLKDNRIYEPKIDTPVRNICSSLLNIADSIEKIRSEASPAHNNDLIDDKNLASLCVNSCGTLWRFLYNIEQKKEKLNNHNEETKEQNQQAETDEKVDDDIPF